MSFLLDFLYFCLKCCPSTQINSACLWAPFLNFKAKESIFLRKTLPCGIPYPAFFSDCPDLIVRQWNCFQTMESDHYPYPQSKDSLT